MATTMDLPRSVSRRDRWYRSSAAPRSRSSTCLAFPWSHLNILDGFRWEPWSCWRRFLQPFPGRTTATSTPQSTPKMVVRSRRDLLASRPSPSKMVVAEKCPGKRSGSSFCVGETRVGLASGTLTATKTVTRDLFELCCCVTRTRRATTHDSATTNWMRAVALRWPPQVLTECDFCTAALVVELIDARG